MHAETVCYEIALKSSKVIGKLCVRAQSSTEQLCPRIREGGITSPHSPSMPSLTNKWTCKDKHPVAALQQ